MRCQLSPLVSFLPRRASRLTAEPVSLSRSHLACTATPFGLTPCIGSTVQILKLLGEGGFSFVYLAQDENSGVRGHVLVSDPNHAHIPALCSVSLL